ncbi:hypothetical protein BDZ91DRAFT_715535 [Kalaharituber pfeilii]|nr:hypothetical protein BDZ91DRAFT_715535 [Kalaharituber pfeilii]
MLNSDEDEDDYELLEDLMLDLIVSNHRYLYRKRGSARSHNFDVFNTMIEQYPESAFKCLFRMQRISFKQLVDLLEVLPDQKINCWHQNKTKYPPCPVKIQIAVASGLFKLIDFCSFI